ncbi:MAG: hypothetical protein NTY23_09710 [Chloroflexi bacterium]|nr:hypothetical protein [Chloroflexota bacterium]
MRVHVHGMDILTACVLFLLYLAPSIPVAFEAGGGSGYLAILFLAVLWFVALGEDDKRAGQTTRLFPMALGSLCLVALVPALLRSNWRFSLSDLGWWAVAAGMSYLLLNRVVRSSSLLAGLYILAGTVNAGVGGFQHIVISPAERAANLASPEVLSSPGWGFGWYAAVGQGAPPVWGFHNPTNFNAFAAYLYWPLLLSIGGLAYRGWRRVACLAAAIIIGLALFWTYSRVTFIAVAWAVVAIGGIWIFAGSPRLPALLLVTGVLLGGIGMTSFLWGADAWSGTMTARVSLWRDLATLLTKNLSVLVSGGGYPLFTREAHIQPADFHNMYLFVLLQYGVLGLLIFGVMGYRLVAMGWRALSRGSIRSQPMLVAMWAGMLGFLVSGLAESQVQEPYQRMAFVQAIVLYLWLCMDGMEQSPGLAGVRPLPQERSPDGSGHARV